ncbi:helix-turn-helix domain-containing protein [Actinomycetospora lemnae]|uniref:Helix-turn-helix transcriptional regulator n=1 Tax=Actinomycetospora lemnae TaxID=3019891 RepID=A0ABT5SUG3_9PSEU|nr:helix-turn-helix transcriptional regulator [Actinomycetospora sp. DW7H6]MDD7966495.1 helix-turn-helix transcriptional regulator [Actinomycetospora sp. DW7H6]
MSSESGSGKDESAECDDATQVLFAIARNDCVTTWPSEVYRVRTAAGRGGAGTSTPWFAPGGVRMSQSPGPVVTRRRLGGELKRLREGLGLKLEDVARSLECSPSKISRLENGKGVPRWRDVRDMLEVYRVPEGDERKRLLDWAQSGRAPMWWQDYADVLAPDMALYVEYEWDAARIDAYEAHIVHGLLQTRDYARGALRSFWSGNLDEGQIERLVDVRMRRQKALAADHGLTFRCVLDESTLYRVVETAEVLAEQVEHLIHIAEAEHVDVRVLPFSAGLVPASRESFAKLQFSAGIEHGIVYIERPVQSEFLADRGDIARYDRRMAALVDASLPEHDSVPLMKRALRRMVDA